MSKRAPDDTSWHREQVIRACRQWLERGAVVEDCLSAATEAARREFGCAIRITTPAELRIDGYSYRWPDA
jgi:hypothetical protein